MDLQSVKTRFMGSYLFLVFLFVALVPIMYALVGGMGDKYIQEDVAGSLRKRAVEITEVLNRHIVTGDEALEADFHKKKEAYGKVIETLKAGSATVPAITDPEILAKLDEVEKKWIEMEEALDASMANGDVLNDSRQIVRSSTFPLVGRLNEMIGTMLSLKDPEVSKLINVSGLQRMRTVKLSYLTEQYVLTYKDKEAAAGEIKKTIDDFENTLGEIKAVAVVKAASGSKGEAFLGAAKGVEELWKTRKESLLKTLEASDLYTAKSAELSNRHTPEVVASADRLTKIFISKAQASAKKGLITMIVFALVSAGIGASFMWMTKGLIIKPLITIKETVSEFARGNLTKRANIRIRFFGKELDDEISGLGASVDAMADQMGTVIGRITDSSGHLASASEQLSASSTQIEEGANRQSSQTAQAATAMEEMSATVIEVAKNSQQVSESARNAQEIAVNGGEVVKEAIGAMQEVSESTNITAETIKKLGKGSEEIGTIVSVINDIADQTNLLALNAAIEAARAGEQGRGFAVVADEVRKLAERTTNATKEISDMIGSIQVETTKAVEAMDSGTQKVENGVRLAHEAGEALSKIVMGVQNVTDMISHIATSTEEQSATTDEITRNMDSIAEVAQSNVAAIGEVSNATAEMARLATELKELVSRFDIRVDKPVVEIKPATGEQKKRRLRAA